LPTLENTEIATFEKDRKMSAVLRVTEENKELVEKMSQDDFHQLYKEGKYLGEVSI
jgi:homoserine kinase